MSEQTKSYSRSKLSKRITQLHREILRLKKKLIKAEIKKKIILKFGKFRDDSATKGSTYQIPFVWIVDGLLIGPFWACWEPKQKMIVFPPRGKERKRIVFSKYGSHWKRLIIKVEMALQEHLVSNNLLPRHRWPKFRREDWPTLRMHLRCR